jgi:TonB family protein
VVGLSVILAATCFDLSARALRRPRRFIWSGGLFAIVVLPLVLPRLPGLRTLSFPAAAAMAQRLPAIQVLSTGATVLDPPTERRLVLAWILLSALLLVRHAVALRRLGTLRRQWPRVTVDGVMVEVSEDLGPAVVGVRRGGIVVPGWFTTLPDEERRLILAHEWQHLRARDHQLLALARVVAMLIPWHPALWIASRRLRLAVEQDCDARVLEGGASRVAYADTLVSVARRAHARPGIVAPALLEPASSLSRRITTMFAAPARFPRVVSMVSGAAGVMLLALGCITHEPTSAKPINARPPLVVTARQEGPDSVFLEYQVQEPVRQAAGGMAPYYPDSLRAAGIEGEVLAQFIVNVDGQADLTTWKVLKATHEAFARAVYATLPTLRYTPASKDGRVVRQLVQQPFAFALRQGRQ